MKKLSLVQVIIVLALMLFSIQLVSSTISIIRISTMGASIEKVEKLLIPLTENITLMTEHQLLQEIEFERALRFSLTQKHNANEHFTYATNKFRTLDSKIRDEFDTSYRLLEMAITELDAKKYQEEFNLLKQDFSWLKENRQAWIDSIESIFKLLDEKQIDEAYSALPTVENQALALEEKIVHLLNTVEELTKHTIHELKLEEQSILIFSLIALAFSFITAILMTRYVTNNLKRDIEQLRKVITYISNGDLVSKPESRLGDEFSIDIMRNNLHETLSIVGTSAEDMYKSSTALAKVSESVSHDVDQQAIEIEQISSAMTEMEATSVEVARHAESTQLSTSNVATKANESIVIIDNAVELIVELTNSLGSSSDKIKELEDHCNQISSVLDIIKGIADQTNLLALNAAIEAARAGEQGRGFAVVADEVRNLAKRTQESTVEIESIVELFTGSTHEAVVLMSESTEQGNASKVATAEAHDRIAEIQRAITEINDMNNQIATAAEQQSCTSQELSQNTININKLANHSLESVSQVYTSSEEIEKISTQLQNKLTQFIL